MIFNNSYPILNGNRNIIKKKNCTVPLGFQDLIMVEIVPKKQILTHTHTSEKHYPTFEAVELKSKTNLYAFEIPPCNSHILANQNEFNDTPCTSSHQTVQTTGELKKQAHTHTHPKNPAFGAVGLKSTINLSTSVIVQKTKVQSRSIGARVLDPAAPSRAIAICGICLCGYWCHATCYLQQVQVLHCNIMLNDCPILIF